MECRAMVLPVTLGIDDFRLLINKNYWKFFSLCISVLISFPFLVISFQFRSRFFMYLRSYSRSR